MYPMLGELGDGSGSIQVNFDLTHSQSCILQVYLKVVHYITASNISADQGYLQPSWSHLKDVDRFESEITKNYCVDSNLSLLSPAPH